MVILLNNSKKITTLAYATHKQSPAVNRETGVLSLTLSTAMVQKGTTVQCQPLSGRDIRRRQGHGR